MEYGTEIVPQLGLLFVFLNLKVLSHKTKNHDRSAETEKPGQKENRAAPDEVNQHTAQERAENQT